MLREKVRNFKISPRVTVVIILVAISGTLLTLASHASTPYASQEAENGTLAGGAIEDTDSSASGGKYVQFGSPSSTSSSDTVLRGVNDETLYYTARLTNRNHRILIWPVKDLRLFVCKLPGAIFNQASMDHSTQAILQTSILR
jgi:hypothetical protein